ncbi:MAG: hypothetical protein VX340_10675, partial [Pseudomonadota bacterium]|nr:hypothetical protein [Pseudomonadota bacterium]
MGQDPNTGEPVKPKRGLNRPFSEFRLSFEAKFLGLTALSSGVNTMRETVAELSEPLVWPEEGVTRAPFR